MSEILAMAGKYHRPRHRRILTLTVLNRVQVSPHFVSVTLGGDDVLHLEQSGYDQWGRFFIPGPGQDEIAIPSSVRWQLQVVSTAKRPRIRSYSIRRFRREIPAFDVEIAIHQSTPEGGPPGSAWASHAKPGDRIGFLDEGHSYAPNAGAAWQLLVGDESAVPAILAIMECSAQTLPAEVFLEVPTTEDVRELATPPGTTIRWLPRNDPSTKPGSLAVQAVKDAQLPSGPFYTWTAGESSLATGIRRHLVNERSVPRSDISFTGYWRIGRASLG